MLHRVSFYTDDLIIFISPEAQDLVLCDIFAMFEGASDLGCNLNKCQMVPI
jgi:hypothetical protein